MIIYNKICTHIEELIFIVQSERSLGRDNRRKFALAIRRAARRSCKQRFRYGAGAGRWRGACARREPRRPVGPPPTGGRAHVLRARRERSDRRRATGRAAIDQPSARGVQPRRTRTFSTRRDYNPYVSFSLSLLCVVDSDENL